jgi:DNA-binding PadR family transcriptional regulator
MLKAGWLETEMGLSARNRPVRIFRVTKAGRKHLEQELEPQNGELTVAAVQKATRQ